MPEELWFSADALNSLGENSSLGLRLSQAAWLLDAGSNEQVRVVANIPASWKGFGVDVWLSADTADNIVLWPIYTWLAPSAAPLQEVFTPLQVLSVAPAGSAVVPLLPVVAVPPGDSLFCFRVARLGSDQRDVLSTDLGVLGVKLRQLTEAEGSVPIGDLTITRNDGGTIGWNPAGYFVSSMAGYANALSSFVGRGRSVTAELSYESSYGAASGPLFTTEEAQHAGLVVSACTQHGDIGRQYVDDNYIAMISVLANQFQLIKQVRGVETVLFKRIISNHTLAASIRYTIAITVDGSMVTASLLDSTGQLLDRETVRDSSFSGGYPGFHTYGSQARFYSLVVN